MRKALTYSSFVVASLLVVAAFLTTKTYSQLTVAVILYPLLVYFAYELFIRKNQKSQVLTVTPSVKSIKESKKEKPKPESSKKTGTENNVVGVVDIDKRAFLKLIGATGISYFIFSLLGRRVENTFFGRTPGFGDQLSPIQTTPMEGYRISEIDDGEIGYYGFIKKDGGWLIMKEGVDGSFRYTKGGSDLPDNWKKRDRLKYDYYHNLF